MSYPRRNAATQRFSLGAPRTINVARDGHLILFSRSGAGDDPVNQLWAIDLPDPEPRLLVDPVELLGGADVELTDAEKARRERAREAGGGIVTYTTHSVKGIVVFVLGGRLFRTQIETGETTEVATDGVAFDPRISPDGESIAYHAAGSLRVANGSGDLLIAGENDPNIAWGAAEFVAAEEMGRGRGFWWGPDSDRLLTARVDTSAVDQWHISEPVDASLVPRSVPYPAAGTTNATVQLSIVALDRATDGDPIDVDWQQGEFEYLARAEWTRRDGISLTVQTRNQRTMAILDVDPATGAIHEIYRQSDPGWIELVSGAPRRIGEQILTVADDHDADTRRLFMDDVALTPPGLQVRSIVSIDKTHVTIGASTDPTELHLHRVALDGGDVVAVTTTPGIHRGVASGGTFVITSATLDDTRSTVTVHPADSFDAEPFAIESFAERPELDFNISIETVGARQLNTAIILPHGHTEGELPVLLDPYGGPHALRVQKARAAFSASQWFADQGFVVIVTDGAGTPGRGPRFEQEVLHNLADPVLADQVAALEAVAETHGHVMDLNRVGIRGWSFGGYLAALAVLDRPDVFHAAVAGAPVTDWRLYDTHYTERYMGHPGPDAAAYDHCGLLGKAAQLERPLMLIHGLADDNVVAAHTFQLSRALLESGRPHQVLPLSGVSHMTPQESVAENLLKLQVAFLHEALG